MTPFSTHPLAQSRWNFVILASLVVFGPLGIDLYLPAMPAIGRDFGATAGQVQWSLTSFLAGFCGGMLFYGPVSDAFGRRPVMLLGVASFALVSFACAFADDAVSLAVLRFLQAIGGGASAVMARAIVRDIFPGHEVARMLSLMALATALAPMLAPLIGGWILKVAPWPWIFVTLGAYSLFALALVWRTTPESHPPERRGGLKLLPAILIYGALLKDRAAWGCVLCAGGVFAAMFAYIGGTPFVYIEHFGVSPQIYGFLFGVNIVAQMGCTYANSRLVKTHDPVTLSRWASGAALIAGVALAAVGASGWGGLFAIAAPLFVIVGVTGQLAANMTTRIMALYPNNTGAATAALTSSMFGLGALSSFAVSLLHDGSPWAMCLVILVCVAVSALGMTPLFTRIAAAR